MLSESDWNRLQELTRAEQVREASALGLLSLRQIERRMRDGAKHGTHPFKVALKGYCDVDAAMERERARQRAGEEE